MSPVFRVKKFPNFLCPDAIIYKRVLFILLMCVFDEVTFTIIRGPKVLIDLAISPLTLCSNRKIHYIDLSIYAGRITNPMRQ